MAAEYLSKPFMKFIDKENIKTEDIFLFPLV